jgi:hypothetical protein
MYKTIIFPAVMCEYETQLSSEGWGCLRRQSWGGSVEVREDRTERWRKSQNEDVSNLQSLLNLFFFSNGATVPNGPGPPHYRRFTIILRHTTLGRTPLDEWPARRRDLHLTSQNTHHRQTSMSPTGFEPEVQQRSAADPRLRPRGLWDRH